MARMGQPVRAVITKGDKQMSDYMFGLGKGHLPQRARDIAREHGAELVNYVEPGGQKRHWFAAPNLGAPFDGARRQAILAALREAGLIK
jgi:hypothetical protein